MINIDINFDELIYRDDYHKKLFCKLVTDFNHNKNGQKPLYFNPDEYAAAFYLMSMDVIVREHLSQVFNFMDYVIIPDCLSDDWQTSTSSKTCRLMFNLWNGFDEVRTDPLNIFASDYAPYYVQALKLRLPMYFSDDDEERA